MVLKFTNHVQTRIHERSLNVEHIKAAIKRPDAKKAAYEGKTEVQKKVDGKEIVVIYYKDGFRDKKEEYLIITAYYL